MEFFKLAINIQKLYKFSGISSESENLKTFDEIYEEFINFNKNFMKFSQIEENQGNNGRKISFSFYIVVFFFISVWLVNKIWIFIQQITFEFKHIKFFIAC